MLTPAIAGLAQSSSTTARETEAAGTDAAIVGRITLDREVADQDGVLTGTLRLLRAATGTATVEWVDSFGRVAGEQRLPLAGAAPVSFTFNMRAGLTYVNWIRVKVNGVPQTAGTKFMLSPAYRPWNDYHTISWAHYPDGFYDQLRAAGMDAIIAYTKENNDPVLDNNFKFYVEQMAWEVFAIYHKDQTEWRALLTKVQEDRQNLELWTRNPCLNDPQTTAYLQKYLTQYVAAHRAYRPLFYNIADELGQGDQIRPNDFCHSKFCREKFADYLRKEYGQPSGAAGEWNTGQELTHWDDTKLDAIPAWYHDSMIDYTTTDRAFEFIALARIRERYKTIGQFNEEWGTSFPVPRGNGTPMRDGWNPILAVARESLSAPVLNAASLEKVMGPLENANARWGGLGSWNAPNEPTKFADWNQVITFVNRFYKELTETRSTRGWNVSAWCDFRNFMDQTFADGVKRAADICKAEDPDALCGTEGGQCPFAFGWYNYEQVVRAVDVIEPYNIGNNVEVIRSLKPSMIMMSTHGFGGMPNKKPGEPLSDKERLEQMRATRPIWWGLFHNHNAALIWDDNEPTTKFVDMSTGKLTMSAETFSPLFHELRGGIGKLFLNAQRKHDGIAVHYSQPSIQIHWLLDNLKYAREWMVKSGGDSDSLCVAVRNSWTKLIEDMALQYNFVGKGQIETGVLSTGEYKVFVMPQSIAVSEKEAEQIRAFVAGGGLLVADCHAAQLNGRGRDLGKGLLDDVFGIARGEARRPGKAAQGTGNEDVLRLEGVELRGVSSGDTDVHVTTGRPLAHSGEVPLVIVNKLGKGRAIYLNLEVADYAFLRLKGNQWSNLPEVMEQVFALAGVEPTVRVLAADGKRLPCTEIVRFANGSCQEVAIFRNPQTDDGGWGAYPKLLADSSIPDIDPNLAGDIDNSLMEKAETVTVEWRNEAQTYDVRDRKSLGNVKRLQATLQPGEPLVYTRASQTIGGLKVTVANARAGEVAELRMTNDGSMPDGSYRVVHLDFKTPSGDVYELYARNAMTREASCVERVPFAVNDPKGTWTVRAHDLMTGLVVETPFQLG